MGKVEVIPASRANVPARATESAAVLAPSRINPGGLVNSTLMRWEANRQARTLTAVAGRIRAESELFDAQCQALESYGKRQRAAARIEELPEIIAADRARRRAERAEEVRALLNQHQLAESRRMTESAHAERVLVDAQQALQAQREYGYSSYKLEWKKRASEMLDLDLSAEERRAILREHLAGLDSSGDITGSVRADMRSEDIDEALHEARSQLRASGLDTSKIDAVLALRARKGE